LVPTVVKRFHALHQKVYAYSSEAEEVEFVQARLTAIGRSPAIRLTGMGDWANGGKGAGHRGLNRKGLRKVYFEGRGFVSCPVFEREALARGPRLRGPCLVEEEASTTVVPPGAGVVVDGYGNLIIAL
jgi:N-methylhydantoinase A